MILNVAPSNKAMFQFKMLLFSYFSLSRTNISLNNSELVRSDSIGTKNNYGVNESSLSSLITLSDWGPGKAPTWD